MRRTDARLGLTLAAACAALGCIELEKLDEVSIVDRPRILAVIADPPEVNPGQSTQLSILVGGTESYSVTWRACASYDGFVNNSQYATENDDEGCSGRSSLSLGKGKQAELPGVLTKQVFEDLELASIALGVTLPPEVLDQVRSRVGLPVSIEATVRAGNEELRAIKRVLLSERPAPHANPPAPRFRFGKVAVVDSGDGSMTCVPKEAGARAFVKAGDDVDLVPSVKGDEEAWLEEFEVLDARGDLQKRTEHAFYSWFSSDGSFSDDITESPLRDNRWRAPKKAGCYPLWLVLRDGHGGSSACKLDVPVEDRDACETNAGDAGAM